ncbi:Putative uncharacterized protein [Taphrina deformans PYCC 5710]|uniref:Uncharacterized protein n=1 Tax=Taphrina deformans (strain PYCC 5710 / ATCC 11124 / CBS 356.35 / IMI 108563 / JCM 9778 / NBRC 8474) TaxID=1097556 RepID=R4XD07_TAPDE|nr:Putative uncharacterized protein [Taphrina deformans PYCC 5710]|eukprot:CCG82293.1 Putative uncharacterized protein [Taphrina deformans PYCC 5710]
MYKRISMSLNNDSSSIVFIDYSASDCLNLKALLKKLVQTVISSKRAIRNRSRIQNYDVRLIEAWRQHQVTEDDVSPTIIIAIRNLEAVPSHVLDELVETLSVYSIDFRFLYNVSTSLHQLQDCLAASSIRKLSVQTFEVDFDESTLDKIVWRLLIDNPTGLRLGFDAYYSLWSDYHNAQRSVDQFLSAFKYASICHHFTHKLAWIASATDFTLNTTELEIVRSLPSFRLAVSEAQQSSDLDQIMHLKEALISDAAMQRLLTSYLGAITRYKLHLANAMQLLYIIRRYSASVAKDKSQAEIHKILLDRGLADSPIVKELLLSVKIMRHESLLKILRDCARLLRVASDRELFQAMAEELIEITESRETQDNDETTEQRRLALGWKDAEAAIMKKERAEALHSEHALAEQRATRKTNYSRRTAGEAAKSNLTGREKRFTELVDSAHTHMRRIFGDLINHEHLTLHELFWYGGDRTHRAAFTPTVRQHLRAALMDPQTFLGPTAVEPHTAALFRLFQDSGQLINLYDWFQAFRQIYAPLSGGGGGGGDDEDEDEEEQMRDQALFTRGVAELKFMGAFKATKRKTDHVQKTISML